MQAITISSNPSKNRISIVKPQEFVFLFLLSGGLYMFCWLYRVWTYYQERNQLNISPFWRSSLALWFMHSLVEKMENQAKVIDVSIPVKPLAVFLIYLVAILVTCTDILYLELIADLVMFGLDLLLLYTFNTIITNTTDSDIIPFIPTAGEWIIIGFGFLSSILSLYVFFLV